MGHTAFKSQRGFDMSSRWFGGDYVFQTVCWLVWGHSFALQTICWLVEGDSNVFQTVCWLHFNPSPEMMDGLFCFALNWSVAKRIKSIAPNNLQKELRACSSFPSAIPCPSHQHDLFAPRTVPHSTYHLHLQVRRPASLDGTEDSPGPRTDRDVTGHVHVSRPENCIWASMSSPWMSLRRTTGAATCGISQQR